MRSTQLPEVAELEGLDPRELERLYREVDLVCRQAEAARAEIAGAVERSAAYADDGHASIGGWLRATGNHSNGEARAIAQEARLLHSIPEARAATHDGQVGVAQLRLLAKVFANPRSADQFPDSAALLVDHASRLWFHEFEVVVRRWEALADADGAHRDHDRAHTLRRASLHLVDDRYYFDAQGGITAGTIIQEVFDHFIDAEFRADWQAAVDKWGDQVTPDHLERTDAQRRHDALLAMTQAAAQSGVAGDITPLVNIIVDQTTFEHHLARIAGADVPPLDPATVDDRRCETLDGVQLDPDDMLAAALIGHVRRVVLNAAGTVIDLSRKRRLFTGNARDAVMLGDRWCLWPGCDLHSGRCHTDHTKPWANNGPTSPGNGGPACPRHNRWKQRGYRTTRGPDGQWHTYRPDGTELAPL